MCLNRSGENELPSYPALLFLALLPTGAAAIKNTPGKFIKLMDCQPPLVAGDARPPRSHIPA